MERLCGAGISLPDGLLGVQSMVDLQIRLRIDLRPGRAIGPGKINLLEALDRTGSLAQAARELDMSYRRAWLLLKSINELTGTPAVTSTKGGTGGGGATLTDQGRALIAAFRAVENAATAKALQQFKPFVVTPDGMDDAGIRRLALPPTAVGTSGHRKRKALT
jgi:molybdate transport system regulatory protein